jgi:hypothetical protein
MSIWRHINDIELQRLKEANRALQKERDELTELNRVHQETTLKLYSAQNDTRKYEDLAVARAVGEHVGELPPIPQTENELRVLLIGLNRRRVEKQRDLDHSKNRFAALQNTTLQACVARAADIYRGQAEVLAETWQEINTANAAMEVPSLSWRQIFIPALEGMRGAIESHSRPALFIGRNSEVTEMEAEMERLL